MKRMKKIVEPIVEVPADEAWLFEPENKDILDAVKEGLRQKGTIRRGSLRIKKKPQK